ncbi:Thiol-disulfide oxidoreductase ResA [compost metagenome]
MLTLSFVTENIENPAGQGLVPEIMGLPNDVLEGLIVGLDSKYKGIPAIDGLTEKINAPKRLRYGKPAMNFRVEGLDSKISQIKDLTPKGKVVLIDFWASWCVPCIKSMPHLKELQAKYKDKGFEIIGVSIDNKEDAWRKKVGELNLPWAQYLDTFEEGADKYLVAAIPYTVLIDREGNIIATRLSGEDLDERLKRIFESK